MGANNSHTFPLTLRFPHASTPHLHMPALPSISSIRAFSTSKVYSKALVPGRKKGAFRKHDNEEVAALKRVVQYGVRLAPLPPYLEEVRVKNGLDGDHFNEYWKMVAQSKLMSGNGSSHRHFQRKVHSKLVNLLQQNKVLDYIDSRMLMRDAQSIKDRARQADETQDEKDAKPEDVKTLQQRTQEIIDLKTFLDEVRIPSESERALKKTEGELLMLQDDIMRRMPKSSYKLGERIGKASMQMGEVKAINERLDTYKRQIADIRERAEKLEQIRKQKEEMLEKKRMLLKQLEEQENEERAAKRISNPADPTTQKSEQASADLDSVLSHAMKKVSKSLEEPRARRNDRYSEGTQATGQPKEDLVVQLRKVGASSVSVLPQFKSKDGVQNTESKTTSRYAKPSDSLRLQVSPSGFIPIDEDLIVTFEGSVSQLQSQVFEMAQRLKSSYPRIDTLPYEVWTSQNKSTLQTWLKILVKKWQTRFDSVEHTGQVERDIIDGRIRTVLDRMIRDHDLSNEAAERMAMRWHQVFEQRGAMYGDAEGVLDWDEFNAEGLGFLNDEAEPQVLSQQWQAEAKPPPTTLSGTDKRPSVSADMSSGVARKMYSTSSRSTPPAHDLADLQEETKANAKESPAPYLPHLTPSGSAHMVSVSTKAHTVRTAIAVGSVHFTNPTPLSLVRSNTAKKGDVLGVSRIAGIMAAKKCPDLIPLCHPIPLTHVSVELVPFSDEHGGVKIEAKVQCTGQTGVEMEALTAVMGAALSVVDMCKAVDRFQRVDGVRVVFKEGGKSGVWREEGWKSWQE
jgi:molybdenum cofactor biosynthesis protein MoaC